MSYSQLTPASVAFDCGLLRRFLSLGGRFLSRLHRHKQEGRRARVDYRHVLNLPDYLLRDIGLSRPQIIAERLRLTDKDAA